ncbi:FHIPEP family type III secretion protein, partial [bacterium]|nr:FHIPEP family type III secretion protein [bacterium]
MYNKKMQYVIKSVPSDDMQAMENLLNEMSSEGWDLYTMHEVETSSSFEFHCIFMRERQDETTTDLDDIVNITSFKYRMEKMLAAPSSPYASCKEIQLKIANQKERIKKIKSQLESETLSPDSKNQLNSQMSDELKQLEDLKQSLVNEIAPDTMYTNIKEEKFVVNLSEEILEVISMEGNDNLLAETVKIRQELADRLGYVIPHIHFHNSDELGQNEFSIKIHDIELFR